MIGPDIKFKLANREHEKEEYFFSVIFDDELINDYCIDDLNTLVEKYVINLYYPGRKLSTRIICDAFGKPVRANVYRIVTIKSAEAIWLEDTSSRTAYKENILCQLK